MTQLYFVRIKIVYTILSVCTLLTVPPSSSMSVYDLRPPCRTDRSGTVHRGASSPPTSLRLVPGPEMTPRMSLLVHSVPSIRLTPVNPNMLPSLRPSESRHSYQGSTTHGPGPHDDPFPLWTSHPLSNYFLHRPPHPSPNQLNIQFPYVRPLRKRLKSLIDRDPPVTEALVPGITVT